MTMFHDRMAELRSQPIYSAKALATRNQEMAELLEERGLRVARFRKPTFAKVAPVDLKHQISTTCDVVIEALAD